MSGIDLDEFTTVIISRFAFVQLDRTCNDKGEL